MKVGDNWQIEMDSMNLTVLQRRVVETGKHKGEEQWDTAAYFAPSEQGMRHAIEFLADHLSTI